VLFLHHGAGGSENMFFDTCGAGRAASLGIERDWLVVAPRQGLFGLGLDIDRMLDILAESFEIDRRRVYLVGHSMGAAQVARQVGLHPERVAAAVALGGGGAAPGGERATSIPWFVAAGEADFGRPGAAALAKRLEATGALVEYRDYADVEHMVIVQAALDDVFRFLDGVAAEPHGEPDGAVAPPVTR
jgi:pimeloyl-ACP methyl ester carboxylesterase